MGVNILNMSARRKKVAIIGAGICGVSSAICLQNADPTLELTIVAEKFSPNLTSDGGAGMWSSIPGFWMKETGKEKQRYFVRLCLVALGGNFLYLIFQRRVCKTKKHSWSSDPSYLELEKKPFLVIRHLIHRGGLAGRRARSSVKNVWRAFDYVRKHG